MFLRDGCEAAAVTAIEINRVGSGMPKEEIIYEMKVNRPFLFLFQIINCQLDMI